LVYMYICIHIDMNILCICVFVHEFINTITRTSAYICVYVYA